MINDRFTAHLRQHLVDTADERTPEGALVAIDARVAATTQQRPFAARLTWNPGRFGAFPTTAFRYALLAVALVVAMLAAALLAGGDGRSTVFQGQWTTTDPADGSVMFLFVGVGKRPTVRFEDLSTSGGACAADATKIFTANGSGTVDGDVLHVEFPDGGGCGLQTVPLGPGDYRHDTATDTLLDGLVQTWVRVVEEASVPPSVGPSVEPTPAAEPTSDAIPSPHAIPSPGADSTPILSPEPTPTSPPSAEPSAGDPAAGCIDVAAAGSYAAAAGAVVLTATLPNGFTTPWKGAQGGFLLSAACFELSPIFVVAMTQADAVAPPCVPAGEPEVRTFAEAVAALSAPQGDDLSGPLNLTIDGHDAARFDVSDLATCPQFGLWGGVLLGRGESGSIYVVDVDGVLLSFELNSSGGATQVQVDEARAIVESLQIDLLSGTTSVPAT